MPRYPREKGLYSTYHIIQRGNERKNIFVSEDDKRYFLEILLKMKKRYNFLIYAFCLMNNHTHLILNDNGNDISQVMKSINVSYVSYFNRIHRRCGHLFQDRFKSELIKDDTYLLEASKYIHNNPVKAGIVKFPEDYEWSSFSIYTGKKFLKGLIDKDKILSCLSSNLTIAVKLYMEYVTKKEETEVTIMDIEEDIIEEEERYENISTPEEARIKLKEIAKSKNIAYKDILNDKEIRNEAIKRIRKNSCLTLKQIGDLFGGISESRISRILRNKSEI